MNNLSQLEQLLQEDSLGQRLQRARIANAAPSLPSTAVCRSMTTSLRRRALTQRWTIAVAAIACLGLLAINPAAQAAARSILPPGLNQVFGVVSSAPPTLSRPGSPSQGQQVTPDLSLAEAQQKVSFTIPKPNPPAGFAFSGALVGSPNAVYLKYTSGNQTIGLWIRSGQQAGGSAVPRSSLIPVTIAGRPGYLVRGSYQDNGPGTTTTWNPNADDQEVTWSRSDLSLDLTCENLGLSNQAAVNLAASILPQ